GHMPVLQSRIVGTGSVDGSGVVHAQRLKEVVIQVGGEWDLGDGLDEASDDVIVHVAVAVLLPGLRLELPSLQSLHTLSQIGCRFDDERAGQARSEEHTSELQSRFDLVCRLLLEKKK